MRLTFEKWGGGVVVVDRGREFSCLKVLLLVSVAILTLVLFGGGGVVLFCFLSFEMPCVTRPLAPVI